MRPKILIAIAVLVVVCAAVYVFAQRTTRSMGILTANSKHSTAPAALVVTDGAPIGLIGKVTDIGSDTVTITGTPPGNTTPVVLAVFIDASTMITKVGPAPKYATSTATIADFKKGMLLNIAADAALNGARHAERIIIPPPQ